MSAVTNKITRKDLRKALTKHVPVGSGVRVSDATELLWQISRLHQINENDRRPENKRDGRYWVVNKLEYFQEETGLSRRTVQRLLSVLNGTRLIERRKMRNYHLAGAPTCHAIRLGEDGLNLFKIARLAGEKDASHGTSGCTTGGASQDHTTKKENHLPFTTLRKGTTTPPAVPGKGGKSRPALQSDQLLNPKTGVEPAQNFQIDMEVKMASIADLMKNGIPKKQGALTSKSPTGALQQIWKRGWADGAHGYFAGFTQQDLGILKQMATNAPDEAEKALQAVLADWQGFGKAVKEGASWGLPWPSKPVLWLIRKHLGIAVDFATEKASAPVQSISQSKPVEAPAPVKVQLPAVTSQLKSDLDAATKRHKDATKNDAPMFEIVRLKQLIANLSHALDLSKSEPCLTLEQLVEKVGPLTLAGVVEAEDE